MAKRISSRRIKTHRQYTYEQAAHALGVTPQTVRAWRKVGLSVMCSKTPHLIVGSELKTFLDQRAPKKLPRLGPGQFRCMRCGGHVEAYGGMVDYTPLTPTRGTLSALCAVCEGLCTRFASRSQADELSRILCLTIRNAGET